jgi:hypothetical protein
MSQFLSSRRSTSVELARVARDQWSQVEPDEELQPRPDDLLSPGTHTSVEPKSPASHRSTNPRPMNIENGSESSHESILIPYTNLEQHLEREVEAIYRPATVWIATDVIGLTTSSSEPLGYGLMKDVQDRPPSYTSTMDLALPPADRANSLMQIRQQSHIDEPAIEGLDPDSREELHTALIEAKEHQTAETDLTSRTVELSAAVDLAALAAESSKAEIDDLKAKIAELQEKLEETVVEALFRRVS